MYSSILTQGLRRSVSTLPRRSFGAMNEFNTDMFDHKFTEEMQFRSSFDKIKCFRVLDEEGNLINKKYENSIDDSTLQRMFKTMVMMNEADVVYNQAQRQSRISFYMTQLGEEAAGIGSAAGVKDHDLIFP